MRVHGPWQMAAMGLARFHEGPHEGDGLLVDAQRIGVDHAARQQQGVEVFGAGALQRHVDREAVGLVVVMPAAHAAVDGRDDLRLRAGGVQRLAGVGHLDLLEAVRHEDGDLHSVEGG